MKKLLSTVLVLAFILAALSTLTPMAAAKSETISASEAERLVDLAYKNGVNYFDTAYVYHAGESEIFAGKILNKYPRESYKLATKLPGWAIKNDGKTVDELFNEQLEKCEVEYFDFYLFHNVNEKNIDEYLKKNNSL